MLCYEKQFFTPVLLHIFPIQQQTLETQHICSTHRELTEPKGLSLSNKQFYPKVEPGRNLRTARNAAFFRCFFNSALNYRAVVVPAIPVSDYFDSFRYG